MQYEFDMFNKKLGMDEDTLEKERRALEAEKKLLEERFNKESRESLFTGGNTSEFSLQNDIKNLELDRLAIDAELTGKNKELYDYLRNQTLETEDQLTMHQKQLSVLKARIALEAALKDESIQTFTKDTVTGGWQVKYIANQDNIVDAQQSLAEAELALEEETQNQKISAKEDQLDIKEEFADRVAEIQEKALNGEYESQEDFNNAMTDLIDEFSMKYGDSWEDIYNDLSDNGVNLKGALSDLTTSVGDYYSDMGATITDFSTLVDENVNSVSSKLKELNAALQDYMEDAEDTTTTTGTTGGTGGGTGGNSGGGWTSSQTITRDFLVEQYLSGNSDVSFVEDPNGYNGVRDFLQFGEDLQSGSLSFKNKSLQESFTNKYGAQISNILSLTDKTDANAQMQDLLSGISLSKYFADSNNMTKKYYGTKTGYYTYKGLKL